MGRYPLLPLLLVVAVATPPAPSALAAPAGPEAPPEPAYTRRPASQGGTGKVYMGREISFVLGHRGIEWLERKERETEERPDLLVELLDLAPDAVIADVGAGSGYITFRLQPEVPQGRVVAVDIQPEMLAAIEAREEELGVENVETVLGTVEDPRLPPSSIDGAILVDAYHEFSHPREMMEGIVRALRPGGRVYLVEYRGEDPEVPMLRLHKMTEAQARREMAAVGLELEENREGLPWQHLMVFRRASE